MGFGSPTGSATDDTTPAKGSAVFTVMPPGDIVCEQWLRRTGHVLAANERLRTMRTARVRLDRILRGDFSRESEKCWECPGEFGADGGWRPHCREGAA